MFRHILSKIKKDENGDVVVQFSILFPMIMFVFALLMIISFILPEQAVLNSAAERVAGLLADVYSSPGYNYDKYNKRIKIDISESELNDVYSAMFEHPELEQIEMCENLLKELGENGLASKGEDIIIENIKFKDMIIYKEVEIEISRSFGIGFKVFGIDGIINLSANAKRMIKNTDEFIRNIDIAANQAAFANEEDGIANINEMFKNVDKTKGYYIKSEAELESE